jgi:predicted acyltransferase
MRAFLAEGIVPSATASPAMSRSAATALRHGRLRSIDVLRGIAVLGMLLVNNSGVGGYAQPFLQHSAWDGFGVADQVYPCFLFIVGTCIALSLACNEGKEPLSRLPKMLRRTASLILLGLLINGCLTLDMATIRVTGVLQRIGMAYFFAYLAVLFLSPISVWVLMGSILTGYWVVMEHCFSFYDLSFDGNLAASVDQFLFTRAHLYFGLGCDPEGLLATLPSVATVLSGYLAGRWLLPRAAVTATSLLLAIAGMAAVLAGLLWSLDFPLNKHLWTSSYTVFTTGWSLLLLAFCHQLIEVFGWQSWSRPLEVLSANAIVIFAGSTIVEQWLTSSHEGEAMAGWLFEHLFLPIADRETASLLFALALTFGWWLVAYVLYRSRILVRI